MEPKIFKYKLWADTRTLEAIAKIDTAVQAQHYQFVLQQLNHMVIVEKRFRSQLCHLPVPHAETNTTVIPSFDELSHRLIDSGKWYINFLVTAQSTNTNIAFVFADGQAGKMSVDEILFHVVNHGSYHRGNIAHALDQAGVPHPLDGYAAFIHDFEPERRNT